MRAAAIALAFVIALALAPTACSEVYPFECCSHEECILDEEQGVCTAYHHCAYPDSECPSPGLSYDESAGELYGVCVGDEEDF
jgi:hypothetical protein